MQPGLVGSGGRTQHGAGMPASGHPHPSHHCSTEQGTHHPPLCANMHAHASPLRVESHDSSLLLWKGFTVTHIHTHVHC